MEDRISITLEEYKELLMIKGKYEELKELRGLGALPSYPKITYTEYSKEKDLKPPYTVTSGYYTTDTSGLAVREALGSDTL